MTIRTAARKENEMNVFLVSDTHFNHQNIATYCDRPANFTEIIVKRWRETVKPEDTVIHLGDVQIGKKAVEHDIISTLPGRKILIRGNHDRQWSNTRWMQAGFDFACDGMVFRQCWLTHEPASALPAGTVLNLHGHLHNIWHGFHPNDPKGEDQYFAETLMTMHKKLKQDWQRLFAIEYTDYRPVEFDKFVSQPDRYQARGPKKT
jgi:calcineurin-like phosphoesterase family protein